MIQKDNELIFQSDIVGPWGLFFTDIAEALSGEFPPLKKVTVKLNLGEYPNILAVSEGKADMGFTTPPGSVTMASNGRGPFKKKLQNLRAIASIPHDDRMLWAVPVSSKINSIPEMPDEPMRLVLPNQDFPIRFLAEKILEGYGLSVEKLEKSGWQIVDESHCLQIPIPVMQGKADALIHEGMKTPNWRQLALTGKMRFLPVDDGILQKICDEYGYKKALLPRGLYPGFDREIPCIDFSDWLLFVRDDMPDEIAYRITRIVVEKRKQIFEFYFRGLPPEESNVVCPIDAGNIWRNIGEIPLHPASERYYKENGYK